MIVHTFSKPVKKFVALVGAASALVTLPVLAQSKPAPNTDTQSPRIETPSGSGTQSTTPSSSPSRNSTSSSGTVVDVAASNSSFKTLTAALKAAGLDKALASGGPYTIFAPTDKAFDALPKGALAQLLKPENREALVKILTYHVVEGENTSNTLKSGDANTLEGAPLKVSVNSSGVTVNDAKVIQKDVQASNGVIHVIDRVLLPPDIMQQRSSGAQQRPGRTQQQPGRTQEQPSSTSQPSGGSSK